MLRLYFWNDPRIIIILLLLLFVDVFQSVRRCRASYSVDRARRINISRSLRRRTADDADAVSTVTWSYFRKFTVKKEKSLQACHMQTASQGRLVILA